MTARSLAVNVAVIQPTSGPGYLTLYPGGTPQPFTSSVNYKSGKTRSNGMVIGLGSSGDMTVYCEQPSGTTGLVIDVTGFYQ